MPTNTLTDAKCRAAKPEAKAIKLFDGGGLHLWISPKGAKVWRLAYRFERKPKTMSIGPYPAVSLACARVAREEAQAALREGRDPLAPRRAARSTVPTLAEANATYWAGRGDVTAIYRNNALRGVEMHLGPKLGARPINSIDRRELLEVLLEMDKAGLQAYVRKVRMWVSQVFDAAVELDYCRTNPAATIDPRKAFSRAKVEHFASLEITAVPALLKRMAFEGELQSVLACLLLAMTWTRTVELRFWRPGEIDGDLWRIPAERMKMDRDHLVPLPRQALAILKVLKERAREGVYVLESDRPGRPISENAILYLLHRIGYKGRMTGHGFRSVASTWANEAGFNKDAIERQLAHAPDDKVRSAYNRAEYLPERRKMLQAWADWLEENGALRIG